MNMGDPFGVGGGIKKKRPGPHGSKGACGGTESYYDLYHNLKLIYVSKVIDNIARTS